MPIWTPTLARRWIASELKRLRTAAGITQPEAAKPLGTGQVRISELEIAHSVPRVLDFEILLPLYGAADQLPKFIEIRKVAKKRNWWFGLDAVPKSLARYLGLEEGAQQIDSWNGLYIHDLLQTRAYAMAQIQETMPNASAKEVSDHVAIRMRRQEIWKARGTDRAHLRIVLSEAALRASARSTMIMREQYEHLMELAATPSVDLQILPTNSSLPAVTSSPFARLHFDIPGDNGELYLENLVGAHYITDHNQLEKVDAAFAQLRDTALNRKASLNFIRDLIAELDDK